MSYAIRAAAKRKLDTWLKNKGSTKGSYPAVDAHRDYLPCFLHRVHTDPCIKTKEEALEFVKLTLECQTGDVEGICISVTDRDKEKDAFLEMAKENNLPILGPLASIHGYYNCYAIFATNLHEEDTERRIV